jgi:hypothetical protein
MKFIFTTLLLSLFSFQVVAQDGYHVENIPTCQEEACLFSKDIQIGFSSYYDDHDDFTYSFLNTTSTLEDVIYPDSNECYRGDHKRICEIVEALTGNSEANYYLNGGHTRILSTDCDFNATQGSLLLSYTAKSDYEQWSYQVVKSVTQCK